jgi:hypothetical protein
MKRSLVGFSLCFLLMGKVFAGGDKQLSADILTNWMDLHCQLVKSTSGIPHVAYSRHFAYTAVAVYEVAKDTDASYQSLAKQLNGLDKLPSPPKKIDCAVSLNVVYAALLRHFYGAFPACVEKIDVMEKTQAERLTGNSTGRIKESTDYGKQLAAAIVEWSQSDEVTSHKTYQPQTGEGLWQPTDGVAAAPFWHEHRSLTKDLLRSVSDFKSPVYSADTSSGFYRMAAEVYSLTRNLTPEQKATAFFWDDSPNGKYVTAFGHWASILSGLVRHHKLSLVKAAEAYLVMTSALHEASIVAWKGKYQYQVLRPAHFITKFIDKSWSPLIATPPHPEFPAAHATLSYAAATALCSVFGDSCEVTDNTYVGIGMPERRYASLMDAAREAGFSRLYGGIHYRYSIEEGFRLGEETARHVLRSLRLR